ncbi:MSMEG_0569 family flavin-dependent oxidoreductase [Robbsia sp. Bb-Pol-6]|uniref:MSMEG_0569 family flavin-dependent oxidoreductase n=1 Tax=Robbsia betulipollinis TaxID=2981849 RepID=A0ABT3ZTU5_9BURK|nr:MSMEG_0569 family flavin-dependent oxidoreductase [Robbsia betulipollinis]MCY0389640.1 MSMEG_0569 family flavin-dependent oxidoreductase [Robbsia betulipollinis]
MPLSIAAAFARPSYPVVVIGAGQAGLSISYLLKQQGIAHLVIERRRVAFAWREQRWDSFCLVTPNWQCTLPGFPYDGDDPEGFMKKDAIVDYLERYRAHFDPPVVEGVAVREVRANATARAGQPWAGQPGAGQPVEGRYIVDTSHGTIATDQIVVATGGYHQAILPAMAHALPASITQVHAIDYRNPAALPPGAVLVVGTGQSGCQLAEDLHLAGRTVHLCVGDAPRVARRYRGKDVVAWLDEMGYYDLPVERHPLGTGVRDKTNHYVTGRDGGHDIDLRQFAREGMRLYGRLNDIRDGVAQFDARLAEYLDGADAVSESIKTSIDAFIAQRGMAAPEEARYVPVWEPGAPVRALDLANSGITAVIWCVGFRSDYDWLKLPIFDARGYPHHARGVTPATGVYFLGLPWQYSWGSGRFSGVARDARHLLEAIAGTPTSC